MTKTLSTSEWNLVVFLGGWLILHVLIGMYYGDIWTLYYFVQMYPKFSLGVPTAIIVVWLVYEYR